MKDMNNWGFASVNGKLAEIFFERNGNTVCLTGYCYVKRKDYKTKREQKKIADDTKKYRLTYKNKRFSDKNDPRIKFVVKI